MKILVVCQHYWPEPFNTTDVCETLAAHGHDVTVLTGLPNTGMPNNCVPDEYRRDKTLRDQRHNGVRIVRAWLWPRKTGALNRVANYLSFWVFGNAAAKRLETDFDVVLGYQFSPIMQVDPGVTYAERTGVPFLLYSFDLWPESLVVGGIPKGSAPFKWITRVSKRIYASADTLAVTSPRFVDYFEHELGLSHKNTVYLPQFAEDVFASKPTTSVDESLFSPDLTHFMFAGNVGAAQSVETVVETANILRSEPCRFHIVGSGSSLDSCKRLAEDYRLDNVEFHGRHDLEEMPAYYQKADAMLATLAGGPLIEYTLPRKVQTYLAASKPIVATLSGEGRRVVEEAGCGFCCDAGDAACLAEACRAFMKTTPEERRHMGELARTYYDHHFSREMFYTTLESELEKLKGTKHGC